MSITIKYKNDNEEYKFNSFEEINNYDKVVYINYSHNNLTSLPKLPNSLQILWCYDNQLTSLPELPNSLQQLICGYNQLTLLPKLPNSLEILNCSYNQLTSLPELPNSLIELYCYENQFIQKQKYKYLSIII